MRSHSPGSWMHFAVDLITDTSKGSCSRSERQRRLESRLALRPVRLRSWAVRCHYGVVGRRTRIFSFTSDTREGMALAIVGNLARRTMTSPTTTIASTKLFLTSFLNCCVSWRLPTNLDAIGQRHWSDVTIIAFNTFVSRRSVSLARTT